MSNPLSRGLRLAFGARVLVAGLVAALFGYQTAAAKPGDIVNVWPLPGGGPGGGEAFRILYRSTGLKGEPIEVSAAIFIPAGPAPAGGRNIIAWAHPTSGVVEKCAPSLLPDVAGMTWDLQQMLAKGYVVVGTDYPGLGTPELHPYLIGESEGRAVLDSVRAARALPNSRASNRFVAWGHSQGGHAVLYAGELAKSYAPELDLLGVAAAAPATNLVELFDADKSTAAGKNLTAMALYSWSRLTGDPASSMVEPDATRPYEAMATTCIESIANLEALQRDEKDLTGKQFLKANPANTEPWKGLMQRNSPGDRRQPVPVFLAQGTADTIVRPAITKQFGDRLCSQGTHVMFVELPGTSHTFAARDSVGSALKWMDERFRGAPAPSVCGGR